MSAPDAWTTFRTPPGTPPAWNSFASASPSAAEYSAGFQTTELPHRIAGTRYQAGTATGKLPAVMIAATPTGIRNVKSCLFGISDGTVCPYSRRPSPRKKSHVSTISWTSPSASGYGLPISRVTSRGERLLVGLDQPADLRDHAAAGGSGHRRPLLLRRPRGPRGVDERRRVAESTSATTSEVLAGLVEVSVPPGASERASPPMMEATLSAPAAPEAGSEAMEDMGEHGSWPAPVFRYGELPYASASAALSVLSGPMSTGSSERRTAA